MTAIQAYLATHHMWFQAVLWKFIKIILYFCIARIILWFGARFIRSVFSHQAKSFPSRRNETLRKLIENVLQYATYLVFVSMALTQIDPKFETLLAGAGILGIAIAFGAQSLVKDVLTGFFILFEDQYGVGDVVLINGWTGTVNSVGLRLTRLHALTGEEQIIPNGQVQQVINYSRTRCLVIVDVTVASSVDLQSASALIESAMRTATASHSGVEPPTVLGVQDIGDQTIQIRAVVESKPTGSSGLDREVRAALLSAFAESETPASAIKVTQTNPTAYR